VGNATNSPCRNRAAGSASAASNSAGEESGDTRHVRVGCGGGCVDDAAAALAEDEAATAAAAGAKLAADATAGCIATAASALGGCTCVLAILAAALVRAMGRTTAAV
jgi:hypothetical protein